MLIFALPSAEAAFHPADEENYRTNQRDRIGTNFTLMCDDVQAEIARLAEKGVKCSRCRSKGGGR